MLGQAGPDLWEKPEKKHFCSWSPSQHLQGAGSLQQGLSQMGGLPVRSRGRVLALNGGCFLQRRVSRWAQSYPTGIDVDFSHTPQMADHCPTTWLGHTEFTGMSNPIIDHLVNVSYIALYLFRGLNVCLLKVNLFNKPFFWRCL